MKIAVGLSGGVDSTIACYLLKEQGNDVIGITMKIWDEKFGGKKGVNACFGPDEIEDLEEIKKIAEILKIPFEIIDLSKEYNENILSYFKNEYLQGRTPNPCIKCNQQMKFNLLLKKAMEQNIVFDLFATGHYANVEFDNKSGRYLLKKGIDKKKDQSYFLSLLQQDQLSNIIFPLGKYIKNDIKKISEKLNLKVHEKRESQDFYSGNYTDLLDKLPDMGKIIDKNGKVLGNHKGICNYTIGQRKGLGISSSEPLYVIKIIRNGNLIVVGNEKDLYKDKITVTNPNWISIEKLSGSLKAKTKIRYMHKEANSVITPINDNELLIKFEESQKAITPGQFAVFYDDDIVIGGGIIN